ncbi:MAG: peptide chain release factor N(5)-glutamine methyltransferase [Desulfobacteraceae bacterium]|nr:peptide chain release factor N(5)-glutamine methyltransferase [Desulfobacteraceae bacterium]MBC2754544.1 peptide chain release factor N(5)-glutamine methyltransferase [Desulfobacteraceae bacterium]MBC2763791.1 peptide chain release factor N(5)-glutamine methyltransferase [ANME-2 cluster archaeon]
MDPQWTILKILQWTTSYFKSHPIDSPRLTAEILLAHVLGINRIDLYLRFDQPLIKQELSVFKGFIKRRVNREPVAYITGTREFWGIDFNVTPEVLIPRPETEFLVEESLKLIPADTSAGRFRVMDVGTGSGAVIVSLAINRPGHSYFASDISKKAITVAGKNAFSNGVNEEISFLVGELFAALNRDDQAFDLIVSNPPYIPSYQIAGLAPEVGKYEPVLALDGGADGLDVVGKIIEDAPLYLKKNGILMIEIGSDQKIRVEQIVTDDGRYSELKFIRDYSGHDRVALMRRI